MALSSPTTYEAITAIATAVLAVATLILGIVVWVVAVAEGRRSRFSLGVDVAMKLDEQWNEGYLDRRRSAAAALLLSPDKRGSGDEDHIEDVLDFFETLGHLTKRGALDAEMVWSYFFYWFYGYWLSAREFLDQQTKQ